MDKIKSKYSEEELSFDQKFYLASLYEKVKDYKEQPLSETMKHLEPEDLIKYGLIPEFIGRLPMIATLDDLDENSLEEF